MPTLLERRTHCPARYPSQFCNTSPAKLLLQSASLVVTLLIAPICAQEQKRWTRNELISAAREIMNTTRYCALITVDSRNRTHARTMDAFAPDEQMIVWLATNPNSRKVAEIRRNPHVTLYYFDPDNRTYVTLHGLAKLVYDPAEKARHWKDEWKTFYPNRDKDYLLIKVIPEQLEVVDTSKGIVGNTRTWRPPIIIFRKSK